MAAVLSMIPTECNALSHTECVAVTLYTIKSISIKASLGFKIYFNFFFYSFQYCSRLVIVVCVLLVCFF